MKTSSGLHRRTAARQRGLQPATQPPPRPATQAGGRTRRRWAAHLWRATALLLMVVLAIGPVLWMVASSLRPAQQLFQTSPSLIPTGVSFDWYKEVFQRTEALRWLRNSLITASATTLINAVLATMGAYSITRFRYPGRRVFLASLLSSYVFLPILLLVPLYLLLSALGLVGRLAGLIVAHVATTLPFSIWLMRSFLLSTPRELEQAAQVDGCGQLGAFLRVTVPLAKNGIIATSLFAFILSWDEYLMASVLTRDTSATLPVGIASFITSFDIRWGAIMALGTVVTAPVILLFAVFQRYFENGVTEGGLRG